MRVLKLLIGLVAGLAVGVVGIYLFSPATVLKLETRWQRAAAGFSEHRMVVNERQEWVYLEGGSGPPIMLLHGFDADKDTWVPFARELTKHYHVIIPDLPGWGESGRADSEDYGIAAQEKRLAYFMPKLGLGPMHMVGNSMGGHIAGVFAARRPARVVSLALMDSAGVHFPENDFVRRLRAGEIPFNVNNISELDKLLSIVFLHPPEIPARIKQVFVDRNIAVHAFQERVMKKISSEEEAYLLEREMNRIKAPTLILWCKGDQLLDVSSVEVLKAGIKDNEVELFDNCGHVPQMELPQATAQRYMEFLAKHPLPASAAPAAAEPAKD